MSGLGQLRLLVVDGLLLGKQRPHVIDNTAPIALVHLIALFS